MEYENKALQLVRFLIECTFVLLFRAVFASLKNKLYDQKDTISSLPTGIFLLETILFQ